MNRIQIDRAELTFQDLSDIAKELGHKLSEVDDEGLSAAATVWAILRHSDPSCTLEQVVRSPIAQYEMVDSSESETTSGNNGTAPLLWPATGP